MSILDIDVEANIMDFSKPNKNRRVYDHDSVKIPDDYIPPVSTKNSEDYTLPFAYRKLDQLPEVGDSNTIYIVKDKFYIYANEWYEISSMVTETEEIVDEILKDIMDGKYNNENNL